MTAADDILQKLRDKATAHGMSDSDVAHAIADAINNVASDIHPQNDLYRELTDLADYIKSSRRELMALQATGSFGTEHIPSATDELDAVTEATADATNEIMNQCETIGGLATAIGGEQGDSLQESVNRIFEACAFQDITGQRIGKVVKMLKHIETQVNHLVHLFGTGTAAEEMPTGDAKLLNGPQLPGNASSQDEIDQLLAAFDAPKS